MKKLFLIGGLMSCLLALVWAAVPAPDFSGTWALDKAKSEGLPPAMADADISWVISVTDKALKKEVKAGRNSSRMNRMNRMGIGKVKRH